MPETSGNGIGSLFRRAARRLPFSIRRRLQTIRKGRPTPLHEILPLPLPESMHIDPANACNFRCAFCPTGNNPLLASVQRPVGMMDFDLFTKIIDELAEMVGRAGRRLATLHLYKDGEPLLNKRFPEMAAYAKNARVADSLATTTNASLLTEDLSRRLIDAGLDVVRISVIHVGNARYRELSRTFSDYERIRANVRFLFEEKRRLRRKLHVFAKINDTGLTPEELAKFQSDFGPISDETKVDSLMGWSLSGAKDFTLGVPVTTGMDGVSPLRERRVCPEPFSRLAVNFDGQVSVCCVDWSFGTIVGDLRRERLPEVWNGERLRRFRLTHLSGRRGDIPACANCQFMMGEGPNRDLDGHAERLRSLYAEPTPVPGA